MRGTGAPHRGPRGVESLRTLAALPARQRTDLALKIAGYSYDEIRALTPGRTVTNLNKSLVKGRRRIRVAGAPLGHKGRRSA